jgi:hypothetical protein
MKRPYIFSLKYGKNFGFYIKNVDYVSLFKYIHYTIMEIVYNFSMSLNGRHVVKRS